MCVVITVLNSLNLNIHGYLFVVVWMLEMKVSGGFSCKVRRI